MSEMWTRKFEHNSSDFPNLEIFPKVLLCLISCLTAYTYIVFTVGHSDIMVSQVVPVVKNPIADTRDSRDVGSVLGLGRSLGGGNGNRFQYSCLERPMDREHGELSSMHLQRVRNDWALIQIHAFRYNWTVGWIQMGQAEKHLFSWRMKIFLGKSCSWRITVPRMTIST